MKKKKFLTKLIAVIASISTIACLSGCGAPSAGNQDAGTSASVKSQTLTYGMTCAWDKLMPFDNSSADYGDLIFDKIYDRLIYMDKTGEISKRAANSWEFNEDATEVDFKLNKNSKWHDGTPVTAKDWVFTFETVTNKDFTASTRSYFNIIAGTNEDGVKVDGEELGVSATDDYTLKLKFKSTINKDEVLGVYAMYYYVIPEHLLSSISVSELAKDKFWLSPIGSGPAKFKSQKSGSELCLEMFDDYYMGKPNFKNLVYKVVSPSASTASLMAGDLDAIYCSIDSEDVDLIEGTKDSTAKLTLVDYSEPMILFFNNQTVDKNVRKAFDYAIDKDLIVKQLLNGRAKVAESPFAPMNKNLDTSLKSTHDVEKAKALLKDAGWDSSKTLKICVPSGLREKIAVLIQQEMKDIGVDVKVTASDFSTMWSGMEDGTYDMCLIAFSYNKSPLYFKHYISANGFNHITDTKYDEMYDTYLHAKTDEESEAAAKEWQKYISEEAPVISLYHSTAYYESNVRLDGDISEASQRNEAIWNWKLK